MDINAIFEQNLLAFYGARAIMLALGLLGLALAIGSWRRATRQDMQRLFLELDETRGETRAFSDLAQQLTMQIRALQARYEDRQQLVVAASAGSSHSGYDLALQMARNGADANEIVSASGVTRHEAALLTRLHNPAQR
jgi:hypothetical protein